MRDFGRLLVCFCLLTCTLAARAGKINIYDPSGFTTNPIVTSPFLIGGATPFTACGAGELPDPTLVDAGCFAGVNRTGSDWSAITLVVPNFGESFTCNTDDPGDQIFSSASCGFDPLTNTYKLAFSGGLLTQRQLFFITEDDVPPGDFPTVTAYVTFASTPEPPALTLLGTGLALVGYLVFSRRRSTT